jgi:hypothetical protein
MAAAVTELWKVMLERAVSKYPCVVSVRLQRAVRSASLLLPVSSATQRVD